MWTPRLDPANPATWDRPAPTRLGEALAPAAFIVLLSLPYIDLRSPHAAMAAVLATLGWLPWGVGLPPSARASKVAAAHTAALWARVAPAFLLAEAAAQSPLRGSGWGEGYGAHAAAVLLLVAGALAMSLATAVAVATSTEDRRGGPMPMRLRVALALAVLVSSLGTWRHAQRPAPSGYLESLPRTTREVPANALTHERLGRATSGALGGSSTPCEVAHDASRGLDFATRCASDLRGVVYPMRAGDPRMTPVPWSLAAHASALQTPFPSLLLALLGLASMLPILLARRRFHARWARLDAFVERFEAPDGTLSEWESPGAVLMAVRLATADPARGYREDTRVAALERVPGTVAALRVRVAHAARGMDLTIIARLAVSHAPTAVFLAHGAL